MLNNHSRLTLILSRPENEDKKYILHILTHLELNYRDETHIILILTMWRSFLAQLEDAQMISSCRKHKKTYTKIGEDY